MTWVLVVDDDNELRATLAFVLRDAGYDVAEAPDGMIALDLLRATPHRMVVLLDLMMPKLGGEAVIEIVADDPRLRARHQYLLMTANHRAVRPELRDLLVRLSAPVLQKPYDLDALLALVAASAARLTAVPQEQAPDTPPDTPA
jgi:CheY-like chemotaxis protein